MTHKVLHDKRGQALFLCDAPLSVGWHGADVVTSDSPKKPTALAKALAAKGMNGSELARLLDVNRQNVNRWVNGAVKVPRDRANQIAPILGVSAADLVLDAEGETPTPVEVKTVRVRGRVAAGVWFEEDMAVQYDEEIPIVTGRWAYLEQTAYKVSGPSMDLARIYDGDYVVAVPYFDARRAPTPDDIVVVERKRGHLTERTVKQLALDGGGYLLKSRSTDPRFQTPITVNKHGEATEDDGTTVEIIGLVVWRGGHV